VATDEGHLGMAGIDLPPAGRRKLGAHLTVQQCRDLAALLLRAAADTEASRIGGTSVLF
jgi:hypothetical protein